MIDFNTPIEKDNKGQRSEEIKPSQGRNLIAVLENPVHFNNIGKVIRCVHTLGVEKLLVVDPKNKLPDSWEDMRTSKPLIRMSASAVKWTRIERFDSTQTCLKYLSQHHFTSLATSPHQKGKQNILLHEGTYNQEKLAVWFGNESDGLSQEAIDASEACIYMNMYGVIESMNVSSSAAIVLYEITKQRRAKN